MRPKLLAILITVLVAGIVAGLILVPAIITKNDSSREKGQSVQIIPPSNIGGMTLGSYLKGEEALERINKLHGKKIDLEGGYIATYDSSGNKALLWVGVAGSTSQAKVLINRMVGKIKQKGAPFTHQAELEKKGIKVHQLSGMGQSHYVYQGSNKIVWLSVDWSRAEEALEDTLREVE